jgi:hypothetical protein
MVDEAISPLAPPEPVGWYKWLVICLMAFMWSAPAVLLPNLAHEPYVLLFSEMLWLVFCSLLLSLGLSWFRVQLTVDGVTKHGFFRDISIPWSEAHASREGYTIKISSAKHSIHLNPFVYRNPMRLDEFIWHYLPNKQESGLAK